MIDTNSISVNSFIPDSKFNQIYNVLISPDNDYIVIYNSYFGSVYSLPDCTKLSDIGSPGVTSAAFRPDGKYLVICGTSVNTGIYATGSGSSATVRDAYAGELYEYPNWFTENEQSNLYLETNHLHDTGTTYNQQILTNNPDNSYVSLVHPDGCVEVWDLERKTSRSTYYFDEHIGIVTCAKMSADYLITSGYDTRFIIYDFRRGTIKNSIDIKERIPYFELNAAGTMIIVATESGKYAYVYDIESGQLLYKLESEPGDVIFRVGFAADGSEVVAIQKSGRAIIGKLFPTFKELLDYSREIILGNR
jgi:WD40 repeat protein